jgi:hypothetical protein
MLFHMLDRIMEQCIFPDQEEDTHSYSESVKFDARSMTALIPPSK